MLRIVVSDHIPDLPFLSVRDVEPVLTEGQLTLYTGRGVQYPWGATVVLSTVIVSDETLVAVHFRFCHRYGTGQGWRYYRRCAASWDRVYWNNLLTADRLRLFDAYEQYAPAFAAIPGSLPGKRAELKIKIGPTYLLACMQGQKYFALKHATIEYQLGVPYPAERTLHTRVSSYPYSEALLIKWRSGALLPCSGQDQYVVVLLECRVSGEISLSGGRVMSSVLYPDRVLKVIE